MNSLIHDNPTQKQVFIIKEHDILLCDAVPKQNNVLGYFDCSYHYKIMVISNP